MASDYDQFIEEMVARCELLPAGQSREDCCKEQGILNCPHPAGMKDDSLYPFALVGIALVVVLVFGLLYLAIRNQWQRRTSDRHSELIKFISSGWVVWTMVVVSYVLIMQPYAPSMSSEDYLNLVFWITLPPLCTLAGYQWVKRFLRSGR